MYVHIYIVMKVSPEATTDNRFNKLAYFILYFSGDWNGNTRP